MRSTLIATTFLSLVFAAAAEVNAARRVFGGDVVVTNQTPFAVRVWIRQGRRLLKTARLQPMESVTAPNIRVGDNKTNPDDFEPVSVTARGLEPPIRGRNTTDISSYPGPPLAGETHCYDITTLIIGEEDGQISEDDVILFDVENGDCETDPEDPEETPGEETGRLDTNNEAVVMVASSTGLLFLGLMSYLLGRSPRRRKEAEV